VPVLRIRTLFKMVAAVLVLVLVADEVPDIFAACGAREVIVVEFEIVSVRRWFRLLGRQIQLGDGLAHRSQLLQPLRLCILDGERHGRCRLQIWYML
jgi:hypothetical protein